MDNIWFYCALYIVLAVCFWFIIIKKNIFDTLCESFWVPRLSPNIKEKSEIHPHTQIYLKTYVVFVLQVQLILKIHVSHYYPLHIHNHDPTQREVCSITQRVVVLWSSGTRGLYRLGGGWSLVIMVDSPCQRGEVIIHTKFLGTPSQFTHYRT